MPVPSLRRSWILVAAVALAGCGGGGGGSGGAGGGGGGGGGTPPTATIQFPPGPSLTSVSSIRVRGTASDPDGIARVAVNGVVATTTDGFATWTATVPLNLGANVLVVETRDALGAADASADQVAVRREGPVASGAVAALFLPLQVGYAFLDPEAGVVGVDLALGNRVLVTGDERGAGEPARDPGERYEFVGMAASVATQRAYLLEDDGSDSRILEVDPLTGDRSLVSGATRGSGPAFLSSPTALEIDPTPGRLYVGGSTGVVHRVDIATGDRTEIVPSTGAGTAISRCADLAIDPALQRLYVLDSSAQAVVAVDLLTLARTTVSSAAVGSGPGFGTFPSDIALDVAGARAFVLRSTSLFQVDLATGNRTLVSSGAVGTGPALDEACDLAWDAAGGRALVFRATGGVIAVAPATGNRTTLVEPVFGPAGTRVYEDVALSPTGDQVVYLDSAGAGNTLRALDLTSGLERVVADAGTGTGPAVSDRMNVAHDAVSGAAFLLDDSQVLRVDLATGNRTAVSGGAVGSGPALALGIDLALGPVPGTLVVTETAAGLLGVDVASGNRTVLATLAALGGNVSTTDVASDPVRGKAYVSNDDAGDLLQEVSVVPPGGTLVISGVGASGTGLLDSDLDDATFDGRTGNVFVLLEGTGVLGRVHPVTAGPTLHAGPGAGTGPLLAMRRIDGSPSLGVLVVSCAGGLLAIDAVTGERVLLTLVGTRVGGDR